MTNTPLKGARRSRYDDDDDDDDAYLESFRRREPPEEYFPRINTKPVAASDLETSAITVVRGVAGVVMLFVAGWVVGILTVLFTL